MRGENLERQAVERRREGDQTAKKRNSPLFSLVLADVDVRLTPRCAWGIGKKRGDLRGAHRDFLVRGVWVYWLSLAFYSRKRFPNLLKTTVKTSFITDPGTWMLARRDIDKNTG